MIDTATQADRNERESHTGWPGRLESIESLLLLLAKAVRQVHTYPATSQVCVEAVNACRSHLSTMDGPDETRLTVTPDSLLLHEHQLGENQFVRHELTRRLRRARVVDLTIHRQATSRDLTRFSINLIHVAESPDRTINLVERMSEDGIDAISVEVTARREVLQVAPTVAGKRDLVAHERRRREDAISSKTRTAHLFPPHRGWIRLDPAESFEAVTLADLAILVDDPNDLAAMLHRLVEDEQPDGESSNGVLERRFSDVSSLFAGLEPRLSSVMFGKLAAAVLALEPGPRHALLKGAILPAVFDGRTSATVLHAFPDAELAESLCLLLSGETRGPGLAVSALDQLGVSPERRHALIALIDELVGARIDPSLGLDATTAIELDKQARRLTRIDATERRSYAELSGFELRMDDLAQAGVDRIRNGILGSDPLTTELACLVNLVALQPNPEIAAAFVNGVVARAAQLVADARWRELARALAHLAASLEPLREKRPEIHVLVENSLAGFATPDMASALLSYHGQGADPAAVALSIIDSLGVAAAPSLLKLLETDAEAGSIAVGLMCERASLFAPALAETAAALPRQALPHVARILGHAGAGYEDTVANLVNPADERVSREALRALSRIGTPRAAELVNVHARGARGWLSTATIEALLHLPPETTAAAIRDLLGHRPFVVAHPAAASRLIARAAQTKASNLEPVLRQLISLRYRFWNRQLVKVAQDAEAWLKR